jgi:hypothetical protein
MPILLLAMADGGFKGITIWVVKSISDGCDSVVLESHHFSSLTPGLTTVVQRCKETKARISETEGQEYILERTQFPLRPAFALALEHIVHIRLPFVHIHFTQSVYQGFAYSALQTVSAIEHVTVSGHKHAAWDLRSPDL